MHRFELRLLGSPSVVRADGTPVELPLGKPLAVLCFLALEPSAVRRTDLAQILWPTSPEPRARASIRQALWLIRKHTEADIVVESDGALRVNRDLLEVDLDLFEADLGAGRLDDALTRWDGGPLRGFAIADAKPWVTWADTVRSRWEAHLGHALEERAAASSGAARVLFLEQALEVRPYRVEAHLARIRALVDLRDADGAEAALASLRQIADPDDHGFVAEAEDLVRLLRRSAYGDPDERLVPEFVGRAREFSALMETWRSALSGRSRVVGLVGPAGIGKTALAAEARRHMELDGGLVVEARAVRTESELELGVVGTLLTDLLRRPGAAGTSPASALVLRTLVPSEGDVASASPASPTALADALADLLGAVSEEAPLALVVEDAHWIDEASAVVLLRAVRRVHPARVLMLWTCRTGDADGRGCSPLRDAADAGAARIVELSPLSAAEVREMVALLLTSVDPDALEELALRIHATSGGSPLHAVELLQGLRDRGVLGRDPDGGWALAEDASAGTFDLPGDPEAARAQRVAQLSDAARALGRALAHSPEPAALGAARARAGLSEAVARDALSELLERDLVRWTRDDRLELAHETMRGVFDPPDRSAPPPPSHRLPSWWPAAAVLVLASLVALATSARGTAVDPPPYGGGQLWLRAPGFAEGYEFTAADQWRRTGSGQMPSNLGIAPLALLPDGRVAFGGTTLSEGIDPPDAVLALDGLASDGAVDTVFASTGEDVLRILHPHGIAALISVQHPDTARFRFMTVRAALAEPGDTAVLASGPGSYNAVGWLPDGRAVLVVANNTVDSLLVLEPGGRTLHTLVPPHPDIVDVTPCGDDRVLGGSLPPGEPVRRWLWSFGDSVVVPWAPSRTLSGAPVCSPDGRAVAYLTQESDRVVVYVEQLDGTVTFRGDVTAQGAVWLTWLPSPGPAPREVRLGADSLVLLRGDRDSLEARVSSIDARVERPVHFASGDPALASVDEFGVVTANRPGTTVVRATVDGWLRDSVTVTVLGDVEAGHLAFSDSFPTFDAQRWVVAGEPRPEAVRLDDGRPALRLPGDGLYSDRIETVSDFDLTGGGTLEARVRFERLNRLDRQRFSLCLHEGHERRSEPGRARQQQCLTWPAGEGPDFKADAVRFIRAGFPIGDVPIGDLARPGEWTTLALQVRPDGQVSAIVNDSIVAVHPALLTNRRAEGTRFHIAIDHAAVDTELLLRDVVLWTEERYR